MAAGCLPVDVHPFLVERHPRRTNLKRKTLQKYLNLIITLPLAKALAAETVSS